MTPDEVRVYQADAGLVVDGKLGPITKSALLADEIGKGLGLPSLGLLIDQESFKGRPYWPDGQSGVTLDYGWDLGHGAESEQDLRRLYGDVYNELQIGELAEALDLQGTAARDWLSKRREDGWEWWITRDQAARILPRAAGPYWIAACKACPALEKAPPRVQTALLSVTYSVWVECVNTARAAIIGQDWRSVAGHVRRAKGSKPRREIEAALIESVL